MELSTGDIVGMVVVVTVMIGLLFFVAMPSRDADGVVRPSRHNVGRTIGALILFIGLAGFLGAFNLPTTVQTENGPVVNFDLTHQQTLAFLGSGFWLVVGLLLAIFCKSPAERAEKAEPTNMSAINKLVDLHAQGILTDAEFAQKLAALRKNKVS